MLSSSEQDKESLTFFLFSNCISQSVLFYRVIKSKYCTIPAKHCFGNGQNVFVRFKTPYTKPPNVVIGLTLVDTHKDQNVRVQALVTGVTRLGFNVVFKPWDISITYQIGVNWMACP